MAAAAMAQPPAPGVFSFLKHGVVLPARRPGLFLRLLALHVVLSLAVYLFGVLVVAPLDAAVNPKDNLLTRHGFGGSAAVSETAAGAEFSMSKVWLLLAAGAAYLALYLAVWLAKKAAAASAAVAACSGESHVITIGTLLRCVRGSLLRVTATVALGAVLRAACVAVAAAAAFVAMPLVIYLTRSLRLLLVGALLGALALRLCFHLEAVCAMAVVVAAAPAEKPGGGAVARAWRLMRGTGRSALLYVVVTWALEMAVEPVRDLVVGRLLPRGTDTVVVLVVGACVKYVVNFVVKVVSMTSIAAYYFECRKREDEWMMTKRRRRLAISIREIGSMDALLTHVVFN